MGVPRYSSGDVEDQTEFNVAPINDDFSGMLEIYRDAAADVRLDLTRAPVRASRMAHQHPRLE